MTPGEKAACITGLGKSAVGRHLERTGLDLTVEAALLAIGDAGLSRPDIDGLATYPGGAGYRGGASTSQVQDALRLSLSWYHGGGEGAGQLSALVAACLAIGAGLATNVLVYRTVMEASLQRGGRRAGAELVGHIPESKWLIPFGSVNATNWVALYAQRHFHDFGTTREQLAQVAVNARRNAALSSAAVYRDPLSLDDYLSSRMISTPLCLYDCDVPVDGSVALVVSRRGCGNDCPWPAVDVEAVGTAMTERPSWDQTEDLTRPAIFGACRQMWSRTQLSPADVDVAEVYDGFTILALLSLEALGFCGRGESGDFVAGGDRISLTGELPISTDGGQLSGGRLHGYGYIHEACTQLRGSAGPRQVPDAQVAAITNGAGPIAGAMLLTRHR